MVRRGGFAPGAAASLVLCLAVLCPAVAGTEEAGAGRVVVKFADDARVRLRAGAWVSLTGRDLAALRGVLSDFGKPTPERLMGRTEGAVERTLQLARERSGRAMPDLNGYYEMVVGPERVAGFLRALNALEVVQTAYRAPVPAVPGDIDPPTPDFESLQGYLDAAPGGIDARHAWTVPGGLGENVRVIDIEYNWNESHEDLSAIAGNTLCFAGDGSTFASHGTAVMGQLAADHNGFGVSGIVPDADFGMVTVAPVGMSVSVARAIDCATTHLVPGDVLLLEAQTNSGLGYAPSELDQAEFDATLVATSLGIVVVAAAGNGVADLDDPLYGGRFDVAVRDSGAILVGAGAPPGVGQPDRSKLDFSSYGSRVDVQGWGSEVATAGYGDLFSSGGVDQSYTAQFSGTSSASPIVTGAAAALQSVQKARGGVPFDSRTMRQLLIDTGTPQQDGPFPGHIGPRPDLLAALAAFPTLYVTDRLLVDAPPLGNGNGVAEPGETISLVLTATNYDVATATGVRGDLSSEDDAVAITTATAVWNDLPGGGNDASLPDHHRLTIDPSAVCGNTISFEARMQTDVSSDTAPLGFALGATFEREEVSSDVPLVIPPRNPTGIASTLTVPDSFEPADVLIAVDVSHADIRELRMTLSSPAGTTIMLHDHSSPGLADIVTVYDLKTLSDGPGTMDDFDDEDPQGTWILRIVDDLGLDTPAGTLNGWSIRFVLDDCEPLSCAEPVPGEVGDSLRLARSGADVQFDWDPLTGSAGYRVWRSTAAPFVDEQLVEQVGDDTLLLVGGAPGPTGVVYYQVRAVNVCEWEGP